MPPFVAVKNSPKKCDPYLACAVTRQIIEIPHDLAAGMCMCGRPYATDYQP
jgi:hypothetical protein